MAADSKKRDDARGQRITPDYSDVHKPVASDPVVLRAQRFGLCNLCLFVLSCTERGIHHLDVTGLQKISGSE